MVPFKAETALLTRSASGKGEGQPLFVCKIQDVEWAAECRGWTQQPRMAQRRRSSTCFPCEPKSGIELCTVSEGGTKTYRHDFSGRHSTTEHGSHSCHSWEVRVGEKRKEATEKE